MQVVDSPVPVAAPVGPVPQSERISSLDVLRGFALLGILLMNIVAFGLYFSAYDDPTVTGGATGPNLAVWVVMHVLAEGKMRCLFSMVFGASMVLLTSRLERSVPEATADIYYRRILWLLLFGIADAYLLWGGDILYPYALCGLVIYPFRRHRPSHLFAIGGVLVLGIAGFNMYQGFDQQRTIATAQAAERAEKEGKKLTDAQKEAKKKWEEMREFMRPTAEAIEKNNRDWRGNFFQVLGARARGVSRWHATPYYSPWNWDVWSMMFIGMGLYKLGVFSASRSYKFYAVLAALGYCIGVPINSYTAWLLVKSHFDLTVHTFTFTTYDIGRLSVALAHMSLIMMFCKSGLLHWLTSRLGAIGQMAFSNYVFHSVVCDLVFCGFGFGLYGKLQRYQLYYVVAGIWIFQLIASPIWLRYYRMGPLEWCWRSLTYWKRQPIRV